ncbi:purine-nucleoside phosphorylase [Clostridium tarantellae]|uniref:Purine nucleoside phosphorylase DeoD-type n=1 Tax=Clostridium tarantellae TaxID=39493 RepID=A0A6I1MPN6_9CLOT|nr:purine-nucleoside phosphorylase [Clostridium tarantellae]MPQ44880.1 purine-nucleoside phosphorylase [Clostridium tarantellae]
MSTHIGAKKGDIAETILLPGDPLRAKFIADTFLENPVCYNTVRGMLGFTGTYKGKKISVQGTGMGVPSISIYVTELINDYGVKNLMRVGTAGGMQPDVKVRDLILAMTSHTDSSINKLRFNGMDYAPCASFDLLKTAYDTAIEKNLNPKVGSILTADSFYNDNPDAWKLWAKYGTLAVEMETSALYTIASKFNVNALTLLTISDHLLTGESTSAEERQTTFTKMMEIALETAVKL